MTWLALDIGGANLKAADGLGWAHCMPFALWRDSQGLTSALAALLQRAPVADRIAVTMTGELCDCFRTKAEGVRHILASVEHAAAGKKLSAYLVDGRLVALEQARELPQLAAASNWHALARFACRYVDAEAGLLIDVGSTTTDIVPLVGGRPRPRGWTDSDRLLAGELVYTGVGRTPVCAVTRWLPWRGAACPIAAEFFATTADVYVILGERPEDQANDSAADGRALTREFARERLARMLCADATTFTMKDAQHAAATVRESQTADLRQAVQRVALRMPRLPQRVILSGAGEFLAAEAVQDALPEATMVSLAVQIGPDASVAAAAHALAVLARAANFQENSASMVDKR